MPVDAVGLVFDEIQRFVNLADVVVISAYFGEQGIGADFGSGGFNHGADNYRVMIRPRSFDHQLAENGLIEVGKFKQFNIGGVVKSNFHQRGNAGCEYSGANTA